MAVGRRAWLQASAALMATPMVGCRAKPVIAGDLRGPDLSLGHRLRNASQPFAAATTSRTIDTLIVGGGIGGLSAAWALRKQGHDRFFMLEMESTWGGNSRSEHNAISAYPLGAHYLPLPNPETGHVREILADLGVLIGDKSATQPRYHEDALTFAPQERLFEDGFWHDHLVPTALNDPLTRDEIVRFKSITEHLKQQQGADGRRVFALPIDLSSADPQWRALDNITMADWLRQERFVSKGLHWWVNYGCRDDYGTDYTAVSAWAGLHYFASRIGQAQNAEPDSVLTWPQGNGFLVDGLRRLLPAASMARGFAFKVNADRDHVDVDVVDPATQSVTRWRCRHLIWAAPAFILGYVTRLSEAFHGAARSLTYSPWLTATLSLRELPDWRPGAELAWDNVMVDSPSVGYVNSSHQRRVGHIERQAVFSYYWPLTHATPAQARQELLTRSWSQWRDVVLDDLAKPHPDIRERVTRLDVWRNGHAMVRPVSGLLFDGRLPTLRQPHPRIHLGHADGSGLSIFEEASWRGVQAAAQVLAR
jgi:NAD(P)-binding Rossmann-like domain